MPSVQIGKYKRPGIFIEEFNDSVIDSPIVTGNQVLVIGSSKRGPVNTPITLTSTSELERIFGSIDRSLESKGSYFQRTISKLLESTPVVAINLLNADDDLDVLEYKSISTSTAYENGTKIEGPYRRFFDTSTFWKKDRESFLSLTSDDLGDSGRILHFTNMSDKKITVFAIKSQSAGFNRTLLDWYGSVDKVPAYLSPKDYASDYLVDVVVLSGDWTNYTELSVDPVWSRYFNVNGLIKSELFNLVNDQSINTLAVWRGLSLIPYFRDSNGTNIFIENVINSRTDQTGLYCAYDIDAVEVDYRTDLLDILGNSLIATTSVTNIDMLSYNESILETDTYNEVLLDRPGNVTFTFDSGSFSAATLGVNGGRGTRFAEGYVDGYTGSGARVASGTSSLVTFDFTEPTTGAYAVIGGASVSLDSITFTYSVSDLVSGVSIGSASGSTSATFSKAFAIKSDGTISDDLTNAELVNGIVLGYFDYSIEAIDNNVYTIASYSYQPISVTGSGFNNIGSKIIGGTSSGNVVNFEFDNTSSIANVNDYENYRVWKVYNQLSSVLNGSSVDRATILVDGDGTKRPTTGLTFTFNSSTGVNNTLSIKGLTADQANFISQQGLVVYTTDDEFIVGSTGMITSYSVGATGGTGSGIVAEYSEMYQDFRNGLINTSDFFTEVVSSGNVAQTIYLKMYTDTSGILNVDFVDETFNNARPISEIGLNSDITVTSQDSNYRQTVEIESVINDNTILVEASRYSEITIGDFLEADIATVSVLESPRKLTRILSKRTSSTDSTLVEIKTDSKIKTYTYNGDIQTYRFTEIDDYVTDIKGISLSGFNVRPASLPNGTDSRLTEILQIVNKNTQLFDALTDKNLIDFRYLVDSYGLGLSENSKQELGDICGERLDTFGILNMPSVKDFRDSSSPTFVDSENRLQTSFILQGGDPESSPAFNYSLLTGDGASCVGYFTPYVVVNDNGRPRNVPPAAWVATTFLRKHNSSIPSVTPWTIAAGITDGQVTNITGLEYDYTSKDIENLNQLGVNPIISKRNRGRVIETENTANTLQTSALSLIHVREVLIELERELSDMLLNFQWKYNTPEIRAEIKLRADAICEAYVNRNGLFNFFNKCDSENNTNEIIDNQYGVLDTYVEPIKSMGVIVNNITILRTGDINSGGFL